MSAENNIKLVESWIELHSCEESDKSQNKHFWAYEELDELCYENPSKSLHLICEIIRRTDSDIVLSNLSAGPMESILVNHGSAIIDEIENLSKKDEKIKKVLGAVWKNDIDDVVWKRLNVISGPSW